MISKLSLISIMYYNYQCYNYPLNFIIAEKLGSGWELFNIIVAMEDAKRVEEGLGNTPPVGHVVVKEGDEDHKDKYSSFHDRDEYQKVNKSTAGSNGGDVIKISNHDDQKEERINVVAISDHIHDDKQTVEQKEDDHEDQAAVLQVKQRSKRVATLDAFRGLTIVVI